MTATLRVPTSHRRRPVARRPSWDEIVARALGPRLPAGLPADRQPARRRGPDPGGLRPGVPVAVVVHPGHLRGLAAPDHHEPVPRPGPPQGADPLRRARRRRRDPLPSRGPTPDPRCSTAAFDDDVESALAALPPDFRAAVVLCDIEGLSTRRSPTCSAQARHGPLPHPPRPQRAAQGARPPRPRTARPADSGAAPPTGPSG